MNLIGPEMGRDKPGTQRAADRQTTSRKELGAFLRSRRERLTPRSVGLPAAGRRRTPGLRREEVATLAGVGVTWYTWLEQGRDIAPSVQVLNAISRALRLDPAERHHLWQLAAAEQMKESTRPETVLTQAHLRILEQLLPFAACIQTDKFDLLAVNRTYRYLMGDFTVSQENNCIVRAFTDEQWQSGYADYPGASKRMVGKLRAAYPQHLDDPSWTNLVSRLQSVSPHFAQLWDQHDIYAPSVQSETFIGPYMGEITVIYTRFRLEEAPGVRVNILQPAQGEDEEKMRAVNRRFSEEPAVLTFTD